METIRKIKIDFLPLKKGEKDFYVLLLHSIKKYLHWVFMFNLQSILSLNVHWEQKLQSSLRPRLLCCNFVEDALDAFLPPRHPPAFCRSSSCRNWKTDSPLINGYWQCHLKPLDCLLLTRHLPTFSSFVVVMGKLGGRRRRMDFLELVITIISWRKLHLFANRSCEESV